MVDSSKRRELRPYYNQAYFRVPEVITIDSVVVDHDYQRILNVTRVNRMSREFNMDINQPISVTKNADGKYAVVDGQHRHALMKKLGAKHILAFVFEAKEIEDRASMYLDINLGQKAPSTHDRFKARVAAKDVIAVGMTNVLKRNGFSLTGQNGRGITSPNVVESMYKAGVLNVTLKMLNVIWPVESRIRNLDAGLVAAFGLFRVHFDVDNARRLIDTLGDRVPADVHKTAKEMGDNTYGAAAKKALFHALIRHHNKGNSHLGIKALQRNSPIYIFEDGLYKYDFVDADTCS